MVFRLGAHMSITGSIDFSIDRALEKGCNTVQIFTRNPRGWKFEKLNSGAVDSFILKVKDSEVSPVFSHMPYLPNLASPREKVYLKSKETLKSELERCSTLKIPYLVTHCGSHLGRGSEYGIARITEAINEAFTNAKGEVMLLLENTSGSKNSMGNSFENLAKIYDSIKEKDRIGFCFDTCHAYVAGYDLKTVGAVSMTLGEFNDKIGTEKIKLIHLNDSKKGLGSRVDRHEHIGLGMIGENGFKAILSNSTINELPLILETPIDSRRDDVGNINKVKKLASSLGVI
jgi:deoxyribonuclease-4